MQVANIPENEEKRVEALKSFNILDTFPEEAYDNITKIAAEICNTPIALVSLVDPDRQWFKSTYGLDAKETSRDYAFCAHSILEPENLFIVPDATKDIRFKDNPLTKNEPHVVFYAGAPLKTKDGYPIGTLCVIDNEPREALTEGQKESLKALSRQVMRLLDLRQKNIVLEQANKEITRLNTELTQFAYKLTHDLKAPIRGIHSLAEFVKEDLEEEANNEKNIKLIELISSKTVYMELMIEQLLLYTKVTNAEINFENFNLKLLLKSILKNCDLENKISIDFKELAIDVVHSKVCFTQIFQNLLTNSNKFCDERECIVEVLFSQNKDFLQFTYMDNGPGISLEYRDKVFLMFETLKTSNYQSTGIGLATVKSIITRLGGKISLKEREDGKKGVCFEFTIRKSNFYKQRQEV
ncbi:Histidine kinase [Tenacibaculum sp. 190524A02b]|uniref:histidine kinase n=1 Tax=Tenacibaculum vairaonense TaxID=3137860 RepID=A0ABM9PIW2_9FLAO